MQHLYRDLGHRSKGDIVEVTLDRGANVRLMDTSNYNAYRNGRQHRFHGGLATTSPFRLPIPSTGRWHVAINMQGLRGGTPARFARRPRCGAASAAAHQGQPATAAGHRRRPR